MKFLIAYYSKGGETEKLAEALKKELEARGHSIDMEKVRPVKEHGFLGWWHIRMIKGDCDIQKPKIKDASDYDAILIGSPNWTRLALPMAGYLQKLQGLEYKNIGFFATTAAPPAVEWYLLSAYLLDLTFSRIIASKKGRIIDSLLLSSLFKRWSFASEYGKNAIKNFCSKIETPISSIKGYLSEKKEHEAIRLLAVIFSSLLIVFLVMRHIMIDIDAGFLTAKQFSLFIFICLSTFLLLTLIKRRQKRLWLGKYIGGFSLILLWTLTMFFLQPPLGRLLLFGWILILILIGSLKEYRLVLFAGVAAFAGYVFLFFSSPQKELFYPPLDVILLFAVISMIGFISQNLQKNFMELLEAQEEIETAKTVLEIKIHARTKELKEMTERQEETIAKRTKEVRERINELEKFYQMAVGRELKMIELKEEIKKLKAKIEKK